MDSCIGHKPENITLAVPPETSYFRKDQAELVIFSRGVFNGWKGLEGVEGGAIQGQPAAHVSPCKAYVKPMQTVCKLYASPPI